jgi:hypothetical protein
MENTQVEELERFSINHLQLVTTSALRDHHLSEKVYEKIICNIL